MSQEASGVQAERAVVPAGQRADATVVTAWLISVGVHLALFIVMILVPWITRAALNSAGTPVTATGLDQGEDIKFSMVPADTPFAASEEFVPDVQQLTPQNRNRLSELEAGDLQAPAGGALAQGLQVIGVGTAGGDFSKYGLRAGSGGAGPSFFGVGSRAKGARRIVYVVDRSGSMMGIFDDLQKELKRSIDGLRKSQKFHVIFYSSGPPQEAPPKRLVNAIRSSKEAVFEFIDKLTPEGMTEPIPSMERAFELKPDLIYFLSDGDIPGAEELKEKLRAWNVGRKVRIFTIAYVNSAGRQLLEDIAREHGGDFRYVSEHDLQ